MNEVERRRTVDRRDENIPTRVALLEQILQTVSEDLHAIRDAATNGLQMLETRLADLEDRRVRALEDWRLSLKVRDNTRAEVSKERGARFTRVEKWVAFVISCVITLVTGMLAAHVI